VAHSITLVTLFNSARTSEASGSSGRSATGLAISLEKKVLFNHIPHPPSATTERQREERTNVGSGRPPALTQPGLEEMVYARCC